MDSMNISFSYTLGNLYLPLVHSLLSPFYGKIFKGSLVLANLLIIGIKV